MTALQLAHPLAFWAGVVALGLPVVGWWVASGWARRADLPFGEAPYVWAAIGKALSIIFAAGAFGACVVTYFQWAIGTGGAG